MANVISFSVCVCGEAGRWRQLLIFGSLTREHHNSGWRRFQISGQGEWLFEVLPSLPFLLRVKEAMSPGQIGQALKFPPFQEVNRDV